MANHEQTPVNDGVKRGPAHEGPRNHFISFGISMILTLLAFAAVANDAFGHTFKVGFIVILAFVQVFVQLAFWMHMKDRGHGFAIVGIATGFFVFLTCLFMALKLLWW
jgi:cytochrome c oxidase subunit 4